MGTSKKVFCLISASFMQEHCAESTLKSNCQTQHQHSKSQETILQYTTASISSSTVRVWSTWFCLSRLLSTHVASQLDDMQSHSNYSCENYSQQACLYFIILTSDIANCAFSPSEKQLKFARPDWLSDIIHLALFCGQVRRGGGER